MEGPGADLTIADRNQPEERPLDRLDNPAEVAKTISCQTGQTARREWRDRRRSFFWPILLWLIRTRRTLAGQKGDIYIVAGGGGDFIGDGRPATDAEILPGSVASTPDGGLLATDQYSYRVRGISP